MNIGLYFPIEIDGFKCLQKIALALNPLTSYPIYPMLGRLFLTKLAFLWGKL